MALLGLSIDRDNPDFFLDDFLLYMPQFAGVITPKLFEKFYNIVNQKIFKSIYDVDWEYAMSLGIAHYLDIIAKNQQIPQANDLRSLAGGAAYSGVTNSMSVGAYSKSIDTNSTLIKSPEAAFWNTSAYGARLMTLLRSKALFPILVVTPPGRRRK